MTTMTTPKQLGIIISSKRACVVTTQHKNYYLNRDPINLSYDKGNYYYSENGRLVHHSTILQLRSFLKRGVANAVFVDCPFEDEVGLTKHVSQEDQLEILLPTTENISDEVASDAMNLFTALGGDQEQDTESDTESKPSEPVNEASEDKALSEKPRKRRSKK